MSILFLTGCGDNSIQPSEDLVSDPEFIVGELDGENVVFLEPDTNEIEFKLIEENETQSHFNVSLDINDDGSTDLSFDKYIINENEQQVLIVSSLSNSQVSISENETVSDRWDISNDFVSFGIIDFAQKGEVIESDNIRWSQNELLFSHEIVRNGAWTPSGISFFTEEGNFLPFRMDEQLGWIQFNLIVEDSFDMAAVKVKRVALFEES